LTKNRSAQDRHWLEEPWGSWEGKMGFVVEGKEAEGVFLSCLPLV
jgi:hypothetical protein